MKKTCSVFAALLAAVLLVSVPAAASDYNPSPSRPADNQIVAGVDANGNDLTDPNLDDRLVLTPYSKKDELPQEYKSTNFDYAMQNLSWDAAELALHDYLPPDMNTRWLTAVSVFYAHEYGDSGYIQLPATVRIATSLKYGAYCQVIRYSPKWAFASAAKQEAPHIVLLRNFTPLSDTVPDHSDYQWVRVPSELHEDGTLSLTVDQYGSYAIITYVVQEDPTAPTNPSQPTSPSTPTKPGVPESPQTGEAAHFPVMAAALFLLACTGMVLFVRNQEKRKS